MFEQCWLANIAPKGCQTSVPRHPIRCDLHNNKGINVTNYGAKLKKSTFLLSKFPFATIIVTILPTGTIGWKLANRGVPLTEWRCSMK